MERNSERFAVGVVLALFVAGLSSACGEGDGDLYPFFEFVGDTETSSDDDEITGSDDPPDSDSLECPPDYVDEYGRCIRFVNWASTDVECGTSWDFAFNDLQEGIDSAYESAQILGSCEVWVAQGVYRSFLGDPTDSFLMRKGVRVYGGFAAFETELDERDVDGNQTVLSGADSPQTGRSYHVVMGAEAAVLDGFTVTEGDAIGPAPHHRGGGVYINSATMTIQGCTFLGNRAIDGAAVFAYDGAPVIADCAFTGNHADHGGAIYVLNGAAELRGLMMEGNVATIAGGGLYTEALFGGCTPVVDKSVIIGNTAWEDGGGIFNRNCRLAVVGSIIDQNEALEDGGGIAAFRGRTEVEGSRVRWNTAGGEGGGISSYDNEMEVRGCEVSFNGAQADGGGAHLSWSEAFVVSSEFIGNSAAGDGGAVYTEMDIPSFFNTVLAGNTATRGGGFFNGPRGDPRIINCVLSGNRAQLGAALYNAELSKVDLANSIAWGDRPDEIFDEKGSDTSVEFCDIEGGYFGVNVIDLDPLFVDPGSWDEAGTPADASDDTWVQGDYHLDPASPCIDLANDAVSQPTDADGNPWEDIGGLGLPSVATDVGAYDCKI